MVRTLRLDRTQLALPGDALPRPHSNCYWLLPGLILAGEYPRTLDEGTSREKLSRILECGVRDFIDLTEDTEPLAPYAAAVAGIGAAIGVEVRHRRWPIPDVSIPPVNVMRSILDDLYRAVAVGRSVYVHCWGGIGRTGTVVGCLLVEAGFSPQEALELLAAKWKVVEKSARRRQTPETLEQVRFISAWGETRLATIKSTARAPV